MIVPKVNLNGTTQQRLVNLNVQVVDLLDSVRAAAQDACPHGRDYVHPEGDWDAATAEWQEAVDGLEAARDHFNQLALAIQRQGS